MINNEVIAVLHRVNILNPPSHCISGEVMSKPVRPEIKQSSAVRIPETYRSGPASHAPQGASGYYRLNPAGRPGPGSPVVRAGYQVGENGKNSLEILKNPRGR